MKRFLGLSLLIGLLAFGFASCDKKKSADVKKEAIPILIGVAGAFNGDLAPYGLPQKNAAQLAVDNINAKGGVLGKKVVLVAEDDACKAEVAANVASKLVGEKVVAVIGHTCSGATIAAMAVYNEAGIPVISSSATNPSLTLEGKNAMFFRTIPHDKAQASLQAKFITQHLKAKKVAIIHDKGDYGKGLANLVKEGLDATDVEVVLFEGLTPGALDYSALVQKIKQAEPDVVAFGGYHPEGSKVVTQSRKKGITAAFISGDGLKDPSFIKITGEYAEGYYVSSPVDISVIEMTKKVSADLKQRGQDPGNFGLQTYAAAIALFNAIEKSGSVKPQDIAAKLKSEKVSTTLGDISFDQSGDVIGSGFSIYQVKDGIYEEVDWSAN
jgi:branched-chain amino acid transport system substrate-binding protein